MAEYWLISTPGNKNPKREFESLEGTLRTESQAGTVKQLVLPKDLKVGTLDSLIGLSDDLIKIDSFIESVVFKLVQYISELNNASGAKLTELLRVNDRTLANFVGTFHWDASKFNTLLPIRQITDDISKRVSAVEGDLKSKISAYSKAKSNVQAAERKSAGSLLIRSLDDLVKKEHFVHDSEYLTTLLVVVPAFSFDDWMSTYGSLTDFIVPNSTEKLYEDNEYGLFTVTLFNRVVDEFKLKAREKRFIVRDFTYDANQASNAVKERKELEEDYKRKHDGLALWCNSQFSEVFSCWMHIKTLRLFVESVLRYGLPVDLMCAIIEAKQKGSRRLRTALEQKYGALKTLGTTAGETMEIAGLTTGQQEYFPYVSFSVDLSRFLATQ